MSKPQKISSFIPKIFESFKKNSNLLELRANWEKIVGKNFSDRCHVYSLKKLTQNVLTIESIESDLFELSYSSENLKKNK